MSSSLTPMRLELTCKSRQADVTETVMKAEDWFRLHSDSEDLLANFSIVLAEALNNIVEHAYEYQESGDIFILLTYSNDSVTIQLRDNGRKMPGLPIKKEMDGHTKDLADLPEGGFGWFLIHTLTASMEYRYANNSNYLTLTVS